ncbi:von Willebrand factor A domain-containing protein 7-like [Synchiropus splendidus]|uniref:von Willebrand factor A domain-containing protein 7-like n=1 Tax=Synchiropus splendidus TaxID=270530 RepID=UPI00237D9A55|nr:von Willebrand factor A domain-containing protein 7-like [Synchiropus splendidus]
MTKALLYQDAVSCCFFSWKRRRPKKFDPLEIMTSLWVVALLVLTFVAPAPAFVSIGGGASTHVSITGTALLQKVSETCRAVVEAAGHEFKPTGTSPEELVQACLGPTATGEVSGAKFHAALQEIYMQNGLVDRDFAGSAPHHFNSEAFLTGRGLLMEGLASIKANIRSENYRAARESLGTILHVLQDFYSHSNWVELGNTEPYEALLRQDLPIDNVADVNTATCKDCANGACANPLLPQILKEKKLTSGYMGIFSADKPSGKCSHGGAGDLTTNVAPRGGLSKDERRADNQAFHDTAVKLATAASLELLEDVRRAAGNNKFLRMMGIARVSVVCFVIDTTGSMKDDIDEARSVVYEIIDSKRGTQDEPSEYILVPFNDPAFGPLIRTADPDVMKAEISKLTAAGGGDGPEMCLSGLQMALTGAPASSHIYVFTDAPAKDIGLKDTIVALIRKTKSTVSFFMTTKTGRRRRAVYAASLNDYKDLALASGGQAIEVSKRELPQATDIILDTSTSALVTVLQRARNPGKAETFSFMLDGSLSKVTIYITGTAISFTLTNPSGVSQTSTEATGKLGTIKSTGNLMRINLNPDKASGKWKLQINSNQPYTVKVTGQSTITFIYDFVEKFDGPHPGYAVISGRPLAGQPASIMLNVMGKKGPSSLEIGKVGVVAMSASESITYGETTDMGNGAVLVTLKAIPSGEFVIVHQGTDKVSSSEYERQSTTQMSVSKVNIEAAVTGTMEPGKTFTIPFSVITQGLSGEFIINAQNDKDYPMTKPNRLTLTSGKYTNSSLTITPGINTVPGTDVTVTIDAKSVVGADSNYAVLRFTVINKITDFFPPKCDVFDINAEDCPKDLAQCEPFRWGLSANVSDGNGTGVEQMYLATGNGTITHSGLNRPFIQAGYNASCCSPIFELVTVDKIGNVGKCYHSILSGGPPMLSLPLPLWLCLLVSLFIVRA